MRINALVEFYSNTTQVVDPSRPIPGVNPHISMSFKSLPLVGHIIEAPAMSLPSSIYRVALVYHTVHGDIFIKAIPA